MLEAIETHCAEMLCQSLWICPSVSASLRGTARSPPVTLVSLGVFLAGLFFTVCLFVGRRDFFRAIVLLLVSAYSSSAVTGTPRALERRSSAASEGIFVWASIWATETRCSFARVAGWAFGSCPFLLRPPGQRAGFRPPWSCDGGRARVPGFWRRPRVGGWPERRSHGPAQRSSPRLSEPLPAADHTGRMSSSRLSSATVFWPVTTRCTVARLKS